MNHRRPRNLTLLLAGLWLVGATSCRTTENVTDVIDFGSGGDGETSSIIDSQIAKTRKLVEQYPMRDDLHYKIAVFQFQKEDWRGAEEALLEAIELQPKNVKYLYHLGRVRMRMGEHEPAIDAFRRAVTAAGKRRYSGLHSALGYALSLENRWPEARKEFETCVELDPDNPLPYYFLGSIADISNDTDKTIRYMREYIERGGRMFRERATEILAFNGVAVELPSKTHEDAARQGIGPTGLRESTPGQAPLPQLPGVPSLEPATGGARTR